MGYPYVEAPPVSVYQGDDCSFYSYKALDGDNIAIDLVAEGWTSWGAAWRKTLNSDTGITLVVDTSDAAIGQITVSATAAMTRAMTTSGVWDLQAIDGGGRVQTFVKGRTLFTRDVYRGDEAFVSDDSVIDVDGGGPA